MTDRGCMSIQLGQLDTDCGGVSASPPACSEACYTVAASVRAGSLAADRRVLSNCLTCCAMPHSPLVQAL